jgi:hypothetical protein
MLPCTSQQVFVYQKIFYCLACSWLSVTLSVICVLYGLIGLSFCGATVHPGPRALHFDVC